MAVAALPVLAAVILAALALLLIYGTVPMFRPLIEAGLGRLPLVGSWLISNANRVLLDAELQALRWASVGVGAFRDFIDRIRVLSYLLTAALVLALEDTTLRLVRIVTVHIPASEKRTTDYAGQLYQRAVSFTEQQIRIANAYAAALALGAIQYAAQLARQTQDYARALANGVLAYARDRFSDAIRYTQQVGAADQAYTERSTRQTQEYARSIGADAIGYAARVGVEANRYTERVGAQAEDYARSLERIAIGYARDLNKEAVDYTTASVAVVAEAVTAIQRSPCMRYCSPLGDLGSLLQQVEDVGLAALILALAGEAFHDPRGTARSVEGAIGPEVRDLVQVAAATAGVRGSA